MIWRYFADGTRMYARPVFSSLSCWKKKTMHSPDRNNTRALLYLAFPRLRVDGTLRICTRWHLVRLPSPTGDQLRNRREFGSYAYIGECNNLEE